MSAGGRVPSLSRTICSSRCFVPSCHGGFPSPIPFLSEYTGFPDFDARGADNVGVVHLLTRHFAQYDALRNFGLHP